MPAENNVNTRKRWGGEKHKGISEVGLRVKKPSRAEIASCPGTKRINDLVQIR